MSQRISWRRHVVALALGAVVATGAQAGPYSALVTFGDSLSDVGNDLVITHGAVPAPTFYTDGGHTGRFTDGLNYADGLAGLLGVGLAPSLAGGTDYAYGGARTTTITPSLALLGGKSFNQQLGSYYGSHAAADPNALYVLWIGANDMADAIQAGARGDPTAVANAINVAMAGIGGAIDGLADRGARHFLVPNVPDLSLTPQVRSAGNAGLSALAQSASQAFNTSLDQTLDQSAFATLDIRTLDVFAAQTDITLHPAAYGFTNVTSACYSGDVDGGPVPGGGTPTVCAHPEQYLYWDYEHPTAALHEQLAQRAYAAAVPEPSSAGLLLVGIGLVAGWRRLRSGSIAASAPRGRREGRLSAAIGHGLQPQA